MDYLREGIHLRSFAQKDPLVEYRGEGHLMFEELGSEIREEVVFTLFHAEIAPQEAAELEQAQRRRRTATSRTRTRRSPAPTRSPPPAAPRRRRRALGGRLDVHARRRSRRVEQEKIGRNDPCWCGSGKKFKKCHGA